MNRSRRSHSIDHFSLCLDIVVVLSAPSYAQYAHAQKNTLQTMFWNKVQNNMKQNIQLNRDLNSNFAAFSVQT